MKGKGRSKKGRQRRKEGTTTGGIRADEKERTKQKGRQDIKGKWSNREGHERKVEQGQIGTTEKSSKGKKTAGKDMKGK